MKKRKNEFFVHVANVLTIALIIECFLCSFLLINKFGRENCFDRIDETTAQVGKMFRHAMNDNESKLMVFANILGANGSNPEEYLQDLMANFCETQYFAAVCIHRANGTTVSMGNHPHDVVMQYSFEEEVEKLPYTSDMISKGNTPAEKYVYQAVPVIRNGDVAGILYGYISLDTFPQFIETTAYDGKCQFYIVDGNTGDFMMDEYHGMLGNIYDGSMADRESKDGYNMNDMRSGIRSGQSGYHVFRSQRTGLWYYTCYQPLGINNWSIQLTIDEPTAFASYIDVSQTIVGLSVLVIVLMIIHVVLLMLQSDRVKRNDRKNLHRSNYISEIQRTLLNAHTNPDVIDNALKMIAKEIECETVLLLSFNDKVVSNARYWPSKDITAVNELMGRNIRNDFPSFYDHLVEGTSLFYDGAEPSIEIPDESAELFHMLDIRNVCIVPITDYNGVLRGTLCAVNLLKKDVDPTVLECVTYDFFMTLANMENLETIRNLGTMDYMTHVKNRNSYETELSHYASQDSDSLWCMYVDANGLHEINNTQGHKAGDLMLCAVAGVLKKKFGKDHTYRIGGDEFLTFALNSSDAELAMLKEEITRSLAAKSYHVSIGFKGIEKNAAGVFEVERLVADAESLMYCDKKKFYENHHLSHDRTHSAE